MGCTVVPLVIGGVPICKCTSGIQPICKPVAPFTPPEIECPMLTSQLKQNPLCDLLPPCLLDNILDFLINLPIIILFVVSVPARFLYCLAYNFLFNLDVIITDFFTYFVYPIIDFLTAPILYFSIGFSYGVDNELPPAPGLWGYITNACITGIFASIYTIINSIFYYLGYGIGFLIGIIIDIIDILLYLLCYLAYFTFELGFCFDLNAVIFNFEYGILIKIEPFSFLQDLLCGLINCGCVLGSPPIIHLVFCFELNGQCPSECNCGFGYSPPSCPAIPGTEPPQPIPTQPITGSESESMNCLPYITSSDQCSCLKLKPGNFTCQPQVNNGNCTCVCVPSSQSTQPSESSEPLCVPVGTPPHCSCVKEQPGQYFCQPVVINSDQCGCKICLQ